MKPRILSLVATGLLALPAAAYDRSEILRILFAGIRSRDAEIQRDVLVLRKHRLLQGFSKDLPALGRIAESAEVMEALVNLRRRGILPDVKLTPRTLPEYLGRMDQLGGEDVLEETAEPVVRYGELLQDAPFFVRIPKSTLYILGGIALKGTVVEMTHQRPDGYLSVVLPDVSTAYIRRRFVIETTTEASAVMQDPDDVNVLLKGRLAYYQAHHNGASLSILKVQLEPEGPYTVRPFVIPWFNLLSPGDVPPQYLDEVARRIRALALVNGTFFVQSGGTRDDGKPLAPIITDGHVAWSYREDRVLRMRRSYIAVTETNRVFMGDTDLTAEQIIEALRQGRFATEELAGEKLRHLFGGFGWLVRRGDPEGFRPYVDKQFRYSYYSLMVKRPQTVAAVSGDGRTLWILTQEGLPHSSLPMPLPELARYVHENFRCWNAVFLDGGGSTQMVVHGRNVTRTENHRAFRKNSTALAIFGPGPTERTSPWPSLDAPIGR